jgi:hypothetical protein
MKPRRFIDFRWVVLAALLPFMLLGLYVLSIYAYEMVRYDPAYFGQAYVARYDTPGATARALEKALQTGDRALMSELQGREAAAFKPMPNLVFIMLWERTDRYYTYLYLDRETYERHTYYVEKVRERFVVTPPDAYYYLHSGRWVVVFLPLAIAWWVLEVIVVLAVWLYRLSARMREQMYGD